MTGYHLEKHSSFFFNQCPRHSTDEAKINRVLPLAKWNSHVKFSHLRPRAKVLTSYIIQTTIGQILFCRFIMFDILSYGIYNVGHFNTWVLVTSMWARHWRRLVLDATGQTTGQLWTRVSAVRVFKSTRRLVSLRANHTSVCRV